MRLVFLLCKAPDKAAEDIHKKKAKQALAKFGIYYFGYADDLVERRHFRCGRPDGQNDKQYAEQP